MCSIIIWLEIIKFSTLNKDYNYHDLNLNCLGQLQCITISSRSIAIEQFWSTEITTLIKCRKPSNEYYTNQITSYIGLESMWIENSTTSFCWEV